jgi:hypothetical protein
MRLGGQHHASVALNPEIDRHPLYRRLGGPRGRSGRVRQITPPTVTEPRTIKPVESRYTDCTLPTSQIIYKYTVVIIRVMYFCQINCQWHREGCLSEPHVEI